MQNVECRMHNVGSPADLDYKADANCQTIDKTDT